MVCNVLNALCDVRRRLVNVAVYRAFRVIYIGMNANVVIHPSAAPVLSPADLANRLAFLVSAAVQRNLRRAFPHKFRRHHRGLVAFSAFSRPRVRATGNRDDVACLNRPVSKCICVERVVRRGVVQPVVNVRKGCTGYRACHLNSPPSTADCPESGTPRPRSPASSRMSRQTPCCTVS